MVLLRQATVDDALSLAGVKQATWFDESASAEQIACALDQPDHCAHAALIDGHIVGFVDGFITFSPEGNFRWEVDLLAVHPDYRGRGLATRLITVSIQTGKEMGAAFARALIQIDNVASQTAFARCGFQASETCQLYVLGRDESVAYATVSVSSLSNSAENAFLLPVTTFTYRGVWIEGQRHSSAFDHARAFVAQQQWDVAGAVIPTDNQSALIAAEQAGFVLIDTYCWWTRRLL
ncbi:MAG: GNAT family N-acetyltransferase [bacterium]|nr:GNAT family N-acetyltransferase [bacterium]